MDNKEIDEHTNDACSTSTNTLQNLVQEITEFPLASPVYTDNYRGTVFKLDCMAHSTAVKDTRAFEESNKQCIQCQRQSDTCRCNACPKLLNRAEFDLTVLRHATYDRRKAVRKGLPYRASYDDFTCGISLN